METYEQLQLTDLPETASETSQSSRQGYPVNLTALQEKVLGIAIAATWSKSLSELSEKFARSGSLLRIRPVYSQGKISNTSSELSTTYPRWGMVLPGGCGELAMSEPHNSESEYSSFAETYATPTASDGKRVSFSNISLIKTCVARGKTNNLTEQIICKELFPTLVASGKLNGGTGGVQQATINVGSRCNIRGRVQGYGSREWWQTEPGVGRVVAGVPNRVDRLRCLGNAVVPYQAYPIFNAIAKIERGEL